MRFEEHTTMLVVILLIPSAVNGVPILSKSGCIANLAVQRSTGCTSDRLFLPEKTTG